MSTNTGPGWSTVEFVRSLANEEPPGRVHDLYEEAATHTFRAWLAGSNGAIQASDLALARCRRALHDAALIGPKLLRLRCVK